VAFAVAFAKEFAKIPSVLDNHSEYYSLIKLGPYHVGLRPIFFECLTVIRPATEIQGIMAGDCLPDFFVI